MDVSDADTKTMKELQFEAAESSGSHSSSTSGIMPKKRKLQKEPNQLEVIQVFPNECIVPDSTAIAKKLSSTSESAKDDSADFPELPSAAGKPPADEEKTKVYLSKGAFYVWNGDAANALRTKHHIIGTHIGPMPYNYHQNNTFGLPLQLENYQVKVLRDKGIIRIVEHSTVISDKEKQAWREHNERTLLELKEESARLKREHLEKYALPKLRCKENFDESKFLAGEMQKARDQVTEKTRKIQLCREDPFDFGETDVPLDYPIECNFIKLCVFTDLWERGLYVTDGSSYGGDFLAYESDPYVAHADYVVSCRNSESSLTALELIRLGRLAESVKKTMALAWVSEKDGKVNYHSVNWSKIK